MPTYEYACLQCGRYTEAYQSFTDEPLSTCPHCGGTLRKVFHPAGILFKGSGFYKTDSRSKVGSSSSGDGGGSAGSKAKSEPSSKESGSGDSKRSEGSGKSGGSGPSGGSKQPAPAGGSKGSG
jgi:putative FmdB family regulatory protein